MPDTRQLPYLLRLLDDESPVVQTAIERELRAYGTDIRKELAGQALELDPARRQRLDSILADSNRRWLKDAWPEWFGVEDPHARLEEALRLLSAYHGGPARPERVGERLDQLAREYRATFAEPAPRTLAQFLFKVKQFRGARANYFHPDNSDLEHVLHVRRGLPISLICIYVLVGRRLGLRVGGCNFPRHFLGRFREDGRLFFVDGFHGGKVLAEAEVLRLNPSEAKSIRTILRMDASPESIVLRVLRNLSAAYRKTRRIEEHQLMGQLLALLENEMVRKRVLEVPRAPRGPLPGVELLPGQLVVHRRYGYRGVVVDFDMRCKASEAWYRANRTQPDREQPWYHVLVDGSDQVTYAAQSSLNPDESNERIQHPLLDYFFAGFESGFYLRNNQPWPYRAPTWETR